MTKGIGSGKIKYGVTCLKAKFKHMTPHLISLERIWNYFILDVFSDQKKILFKIVSKTRRKSYTSIARRYMVVSKMNSSRYKLFETPKPSQPENLNNYEVVAGRMLSEVYRKVGFIR